MDNNCDITLVILTLNEEMHLERCISSARSLVRRVVVVDSGSTDTTRSLATKLGAEVYVHPFENQAVQLQWALSNCQIHSEWVMRLDADEYLEPLLVESLRREANSVPAVVNGFEMSRKHIFMGKWIRHGGRYPVILLRVWRNGFALPENRPMDEHMILLSGETRRLNGSLVDENLNDLRFFLMKHISYADREAAIRISEGDSCIPSGLPAQAIIKRRIKSLYNRLPFGSGPFAYFIYRYFLRAGFLDGPEGFIYHFLQGLWYRQIVEVRLLELRRRAPSRRGL